MVRGEVNANVQVADSRSAMQLVARISGLMILACKKNGKGEGKVVFLG